MKTKTEKPTNSRNRARRRGNRYCAPSCGRGCTVAEHRRAVERATALAAKLGNAWGGVVWENSGWHSKAVHPSGLELNQFAPRDFWATTDGNEKIKQHHARGTSPANALAKLREQLAATHSAAGVMLVAIDTK